VTRRIGVFGAGKLARAIEEEVREVTAKAAQSSEPPPFSIAWMLDKGDSVPAEKVDVAIDASVPDAVEAHLEWAIETSTPLLVATTGWNIPDIETRVGTRTAVLVSPNFSFAVTFMRRIAAQLARFADWYGEGDLAIFEQHHAAKKDAPSGTAKALAQTIVAASKRYTGWSASGWEVWDQSKVAVASLRAGSEAGVHEVVFDAPHEQLSIVHRARDRRVFASGALKAAQWIIGREGLFGMDDVLESMFDDSRIVEKEAGRR
jgi:4-hydroxy-tetrahydrodipicolinate reductase